MTVSLLGQAARIKQVDTRLFGTTWEAVAGDTVAVIRRRASGALVVYRYTQDGPYRIQAADPSGPFDSWESAVSSIGEWKG